MREGRHKTWLTQRVEPTLEQLRVGGKEGSIGLGLALVQVAQDGQLLAQGLVGALEWGGGDSGKGHG